MDLSLQFVLDYYTKLTQHYDNGHVQPPDVILPPVPEVSEGCLTVPSPYQYLLPSVILWDPLEQLDCFENGLECPYEGHKEEGSFYLLEPKKSRKGDYCWQAGYRASQMPRHLSSSSWPTVLLSKIYHCRSKLNHKTYIAHDPEILSKIPSSESHKIPFVLLHKTGFTKELCETVVSLAAAGMTLVDIEQVICQQHMTNFIQCKAKFEEDKALCLSNAGLQVDEIPVLFPDYKPIGLPSMEMILGSFLESYQDYKPYYHQRMSEISAEVLLIGHFFKSNPHIGTLEADGKKWVSLYNNIFAVMNEKGQVIAWQATKGTSIENTSLLLQNVHIRLKKHGVDIKLILMAECCKQKDFIQSIFGPNVQVKMDPKLASRRLEKKFKVRAGDHDHVATCLQEFGLVFQKSTDLNTERKEETASPETILGNLCSFITHWKIMKGETNERLLHDPALRELEDIKNSVSKGCLSDVPPNSGAKYVNELREFLQPVLNKQFMSVDLAIPAITVLFYCWNENHSERETFQPVNSYKAALDTATFLPTVEQFGSIDVEIESSDNEHCLLSSNFCSSFSLLFSLLWEVDDKSCLIDTELSETTSTEFLSKEMLSKVLVLAENSYLIHQNLKYIYLEKAFPVDMWHYHLLPCCTQIFTRNHCHVSNESSSSSTLQNIVESFGGTIVNSTGRDTDGFFIALIHSLHSLLNSLESENQTEAIQMKEHLNLMGYNVEELKDSREGVPIIRQLVSCEWLQNMDKYSKLLVSPLLDFTQEAELFTHIGYFQAEMINLLPIAAVRVLRLSLVIFTSMEHFPVIPVSSAEKPITSKCLFMAYSAAGCGSYYSVDLTPSQPSKPKHTCRCGLSNSKSKERQFCVHISGQYLTRCECFRSGEACNHLCRCFNCSNPNGTSTESRASYRSQKTRIRTKHKLQQMKKKPVNVKCYSSWTEKECLTFSYLADALQFAHSLTSMSDIIPDILVKEYHNLQQLCEGKMMLKQKSLDDVKQHLAFVSTGLDKFKKLFRIQMEKNWDHTDSVYVDAADNNQLVVIVDNSEQINEQ